MNMQPDKKVFDLSKVFIVNSNEDNFSALLIETIKEKFGHDVIIINKDQATPADSYESNLNSEIFTLSPSQRLKEYKPVLTGQEKRRRKRQQIRLNK